MEASDTVKLQSLAPYRHLFPPARVVNETEKRGASVSDTVEFIPKIIKLTAWQVEKYVEQELKDLSTYEACKKLWHFVKTHIKYEKDEQAKEQVRSPRRLIHDAKGDCDCMTTFIGACLYTLKIPFINRITKYKEDRFQHIYPIVPIVNGKYITMDCVVGKFNYEEPYSEKKDYNMELQFLDGIEEAKQNPTGLNANDPFRRSNDIGDLGRFLKKLSVQKKAGIFNKKTPEQKVVLKQKQQVNKKKALKVVNKVNKVNPVTALLRGGILASMKLNLMSVAEKIKWGYASRELAQSKGMDMSKYEKVKQILQKAEKIFYAAGGKPENLKKAILTGRGNRNNEVSGFDGWDEDTALSDLLGEVYQDEFVNGLEGMEGLGEPATAAAITAASGAMGALAALFASMGPIFPKKTKEKKVKQTRKEKRAIKREELETNQEPNSENPQQETETQEMQTQESTELETTEEATENVPVISNEEAEESSTEITTTEGQEEEPTETTEEIEEGTDGILSKPIMGIKAFYEKNKKWIKPVGITVAAITTFVIINQLCKEDDKKETKTESEKYEVNGVENKKKKKKKRDYESKKQSILALM